MALVGVPRAAARQVDEAEDRGDREDRDEAEELARRHASDRASVREHLPQARVAAGAGDGLGRGLLGLGAVLRVGLASSGSSAASAGATRLLSRRSSNASGGSAARDRPAARSSARPTLIAS